MVLSHPIELRTDIWKGLADDELLDLCQGNKHLKIERDESGNILIKSPTNFLTEFFNSNLLYLLMDWNKKFQVGKFTGSSGGFILPDNSMRAPDIAFVLNENIEKFTKEELYKFPHLCPDFVVEVISSKEELAEAKKKMKMWMSNGCQISWLLDSFEQKIYIEHKGGIEYIHEDFSVELKGNLFLNGFSFIPKDIF